MMNPIAQATSPPPQFNLEGVGSPRGKRFSTAAELEAHLIEWVDATPARIPFELREQAADVIRTCWLEKATNLNLAGMQLGRLPDVVFEMDHLHLLNLSDNQLIGLPDTVQGLTGLKTLNLARNPLRTLPNVLPNLDGLMLMGAGLKEYPRHLFDLPIDCMIYLQDVSLDRAEERWLADQRKTHSHGPTVDKLGPPRRNSGSAPDLRRTSSDNEAHAPANTVIGFAWHSPGAATTPTIGPANSGAAPVVQTSATQSPTNIRQPTHQRGTGAALEALWRRHWGTPTEPRTRFPEELRARSETRRPSDGLDNGLCLELRAWIQCALDQDTKSKHRAAARSIQICIDRAAKNLNLGDIGLTELPDIVWAQTQLTQLNLGGNQLKTQALAGIGKLKNLSHLLLQDNLLSELPLQIAALSDLRVLNLSKNFFAQPPAEIGCLSRLEFLYLNDNLIPKHRAPPKTPANCYVTF